MYRIITGINPKYPDKLSDEELKTVDEYSVEDMINNFTAFNPGLDLEFNWLLKPQTHWLDHSSIKLLNFYNYDNEVTKLLLKFQFIPNLTFKMNTTVRPKDFEILKTVDDFAKQQYKVDYDFFKTKGIQFT